MICPGNQSEEEAGLQQASWYSLGRRSLRNEIALGNCGCAVQLFPRHSALMRFVLQFFAPRALENQSPRSFSSLPDMTATWWPRVRSVLQCLHRFASFSNKVRIQFGKLRCCKEETCVRYLPDQLHSVFDSGTFCHLFQYILPKAQC